MKICWTISEDICRLGVLFFINVLSLYLLFFSYIVFNSFLMFRSFAIYIRESD